MMRLKEILNSIATGAKNRPKTTIGLCATVGIILLARFMHRKIIYLPELPGMAKSPSMNPRPYRNPVAYQLESEDVEIQTKDGNVLRGWFIQPEKGAERIILYYHENAGNIGFRLPFIKYLVHMTRSKVIIVAYRGYSDSTGTPSEKGLKIDGTAILNYAIEKSKQENLELIVFGRSLGGAVAINSVAECQDLDRIKGVILENTFTSISHVGQYLFGQYLFGNYLTSIVTRFLLFLVLTNKWESYKKMGMIKKPVLFIKSAKDELIPKSQMDELEKLCTSKKQSYVVPQGTHNQTWALNVNEYFEVVNKFLKQL